MGVYKTSFALLLLLIIAAGLTAVAFNYYKPSLEMNGKEIKVGEASLVVRIAITPEQHRAGLSKETRLEDNTGMLFIFSDEQYRTFWNKDTLMDLDVLWVRDGKVVGIDFLPNESTRGIVRILSPRPVDAVIETPAGWSETNAIAIGNEVTY